MKSGRRGYARVGLLCGLAGRERTGRQKGVEEVIGSIGLKCNNVNEICGQSAEIGYWLSEEFWGKGWMTELLAGFVEWVLEVVSCRPCNVDTRVWIWIWVWVCVEGWSGGS